MTEIQNSKIYLERMGKAIDEKLKIKQFLPKQGGAILDVGCANGTTTKALAKQFSKNTFLGIDFNEDFIKAAQKSSQEEGIENARFETSYLRNLLVKGSSYDAVLFLSVLHEFFSYGEGISSVLKALADAHELLRPGGFIIIRDMIFPQHAKTATLWINQMSEKIRNKNELHGRLNDFEERFGKIDTLFTLNHFLLKYFYIENWERENKEYYVPVTFEEYEKVFALLDMTLQYQRSYTIPFLQARWREDFGFSDEEIETLRSTGILVAQKKGR